MTVAQTFGLLQRGVIRNEDHVKSTIASERIKVVCKRRLVGGAIHRLFRPVKKKRTAKDRALRDSKGLGWRVTLRCLQSGPTVAYFSAEYLHAGFAGSRVTQRVLSINL